MGDEGDKGAGDTRLEYLQQYTLKTTKQVSLIVKVDKLLTTCTVIIYISSARLCLYAFRL